jgi:hemolysin activation/secretion protein
LQFTLTWWSFYALQTATFVLLAKIMRLNSRIARVRYRNRFAKAACFAGVALAENLVGPLAGIGLAQAQPAASEVTPRSLRPEPVTPPPVAPPNVDLPSGVPTRAPKSAENLHVTIKKAVVDGAFTELSDTASRIFKPLEGHRVSVAQLYQAATELEQAYVKAGYMLARVAVPQQSLSDGGDFHVVVVDGFIEQVDVSKVPENVRGPIGDIVASLVGVHKLETNLLQATLTRAGAVFGAQLRSTLLQGDTPGGARLVLDGGYSEFGASLSASNNLGPVFNNWGLNLSAQVNSPTGHGEQVYGFLSGGPRVDQYFGKEATRLVGGGGIILPMTSWGLQVNPEFTISDTRPLSANPLLVSHDRLYRGSLNWIFPVPLGEPGATTGKFTTEMVDERTELPVFNIDLAHDRLTVLRGNLSWNGAWEAMQTGLHADITLSKGVPWLGARSAAGDALEGMPLSRGSNSEFTKFEVTLGASQNLPYGALLNLTARTQTSFNGLVPSSETFDLTSETALSSYTQGALSADAGYTVRAQLEYPFQSGVKGYGVGATPYLFLADGGAWPVEADDVTPTQVVDFGLGLRLDGTQLPWVGAAPSFALEYGHAEPNRGGSAPDYVRFNIGVQL